MYNDCKIKFYESWKWECHELKINQNSNQSTKHGGRKNYSTLDGIIELVHEIQIANKNKRVMSCLFLDMKIAFDYVNKIQLLRNHEYVKNSSGITQLD